MPLSENASRADNQQERLMIGWVIGFVDGEGCFTINFIKQPERKENGRVRRGYITGYQIAHEFAVVQGERSLAVLKDLRKFFKVGDIYINRRHDNHKENLYRYTVRRRQDLIDVIIPFFKKYELKTAKKNDFKLFVECMENIRSNKHLTRKGAIEIAQICQKMNHQKSRAKIIRILRNQTSDSARCGKDRVLSA